MTVDATDATILTASVEIRMLTISGRSLTMATFRQFPFAGNPLFSDEPFRVWGWINYFWDGCGAKNKHWLIERGGALMRAHVESFAPRKSGNLFDDYFLVGSARGREHFEEAGLWEPFRFARESATEEAANAMHSLLRAHVSDCHRCGTLLREFEADCAQDLAVNARLALRRRDFELAPQLFIAT